tara:strand:- start:68 stop:550 length:483 start_codon:yes stop_codon:yes gene_type:complete
MKLRTIISNFSNIILILLLMGCGYKIVNKNFLNDYKISEIIVTGDRKISYLLENNLRFTNTNESSKNINIQVEVIKDKIVKEKNIQNQITKYQISVRAIVKFEIPEIKKIDNFTIIENGEFSVAARQRETLDNENKLIKNISSNLESEIIQNLRLKLNDL